VALTHVSGRIRLSVSIAGVAAAALAATVLVVPGLASASPAQPSTPATSPTSTSASSPTSNSPTSASPTSVVSAQAKLASLAKQNEAITEQFNAAQAALSASQKAAAQAQKAAAAAQQAYATARDQFGSTVAAQYETQSFSAAGALFSSDSGQQYLDKVSQMSLLSQHRVAQVTELSSVKANANQAKQTAAALVAVATSKQAALAKQKATIQSETAKYTALLQTLSLAEQLAFRNRKVAPAAMVAEVAALPVVAPNPRAQKAVDYAKAQLGKWYRFAAAGPSLYDCSGLTMMAWKQAGVSLPHLASGQANFGSSVTLAQLQPGDLIFLYRPIEHVEIYVGNNLAISAPEEGEQVQYVDVRTLGADFTKAVRL
jgi:cell wall-associated NlpC family hydrolase